MVRISWRTIHLCIIVGSEASFYGEAPRAYKPRTHVGIGDAFRACERRRAQAWRHSHFTSSRSIRASGEVGMFSSRADL
jgi:hypothetical protein